MKAYLLLEDGTLFTGRSIGAVKEVVSEIVFNTSMTGYLEVLTDPSYAGQAVVMTYPLIGNYGVCREDMESGRAWPDALIVRELAELASNFRSRETLQQFLIAEDVPGIEGIDTRALTKLLRERGTMNGFLTTNPDFDREDAMRRMKEYQVLGAVARVSCKEKYVIPGKGKKVAIIDCGIKRNMLRELSARGLELTVWPQDARAEDILAEKPDGIFLPNGPGDPAENVGLIREIKKLYDTDMPIFAICLGHQLMALATGAKTYKMKYGHRGGNHPVRDLVSGRAYISSQNHGYAVDDKSLDPKVAETRFVNVNDGTNEGLAYCGKNILTVQFHPEACPGPHDTSYLFDRFLEMMEVQHA